MKVLLNDTWPRNVCFLYFDQDGLLAQGNQELIMRIFNKIPKRSPDGKRLQVHYLLLCLLSVLILTEVRIVKEKKTHLLADECIMIQLLHEAQPSAVRRTATPFRKERVYLSVT